MKRITCVVAMLLATLAVTTARASIDDFCNHGSAVRSADSVDLALPVLAVPAIDQVAIAVPIGRDLPGNLIPSTSYFVPRPVKSPPRVTYEVRRYPQRE